MAKKTWTWNEIYFCSHLHEKQSGGGGGRSSYQILSFLNFPNNRRGTHVPYQSIIQHDPPEVGA